MDFGSLLYAAQRNERSSNKEPVRCYKTSFEPPKKDSKGKALSVNIKRFLQKKEEEERRKDEEAKKKREELVALRSQDKKAQKRVQVMLKRTKSANKSVMEDAIDDVNTVVTMAGPVQPDEDDYGYVSQEASAYYNKLMDKYANLPPEEPKFSQARKTTIKDVKEMNAAKERVRQALNRVEEEETMPHKRKRKSKTDNSKEDDNFIDDNDYRQGSCKEEVCEPPPPKKQKRPLAPPPLDFNSLLKIAEQKQFEPIVIEKKVEEEERPLTKKQKIEFEREKDWRMRKSERESDSGKPKDNSKRIPKLSESQNRIPKISDSQSRISKLSECQNRIPKLSETQNKKNVLSDGKSSKGVQNVNHSSGDAKRYQQEEDYERQRSSSHLQSKPLVQFDRGRQSSNMKEHNSGRTSDNIERKRHVNSPDVRYQESDYNRHSNERRNFQIKSCNDKKRMPERSDNHSAQYDDSDSDKSKSDYNKPRHRTGEERKYPQAKSDQIRSLDYERSKKYNNDSDNRKSHENHGSKYEQNRSRTNLNRERQYSSMKSSHERSRSPESDQETSRYHQDDRQHKNQSKQYFGANRTHKVCSDNSNSRSPEDDRQFTCKSVHEKPRSEYNETRRSTQMKSDHEDECSRSYDSNYENSDEDNPQNSKIDHEISKPEFNRRKSNYQMKFGEERTQSPYSNFERNDYDDNKSRVAQSNCDRQNANQNKRRSYERSRSYESEDKHPKSNHEKSRSEIQYNRHNSQVKLGRDREPTPNNRSRHDHNNIKPSSTSEQSKSFLYSDSESDRKRILAKQDQRKLQQSIESNITKNVSKTNKLLSVNSDSEKQRVNWKSNHERTPESHPRPFRNSYDERSTTNPGHERSQNLNKYDREKSKFKNDIKHEGIHYSDSDKCKSFKKIDARSTIENSKDKSKPSISAQERSRINNQGFSNPKDKMVTTVPNAEERLKKSADVWSKPCNITSPRPSLKSESVARQKDGLSLKAAENRNNYKCKFSEENRNSSPSSSGSKSVPKDNNRSSSSNYSERKIMVGKPGPVGKPNLMKAAAARAAELRSQKPNVPSERKNDRTESSKSEVPSSSIKPKPRQFPPNDLKPKQFPPADLKPKLFPPKDMRPKQFPPPDVRKRPKPLVKRRIISDSEEEHDSEMDDFIDDDPEEGEDYSKYISEIFGYDKSKYSQFDDDDDECMESSFAQQMKEDIRSTKIGIMEDLEDMRKEKEEKMRALKKKLTSKHRR